DRDELVAELELVVRQTMVFRTEYERDAIARSHREDLRRRLPRAQRASTVRAGPARRADDPAAIGDRFAERPARLHSLEDVRGVHGHLRRRARTIAARRDQ